MIDWGIGQYELTAAELEPVAERVVSLAALSGGELVLDLACGTGNAALLAARQGARASGLDSSPRLIEVARRRAAAAEVEVTFRVGDMQVLPFEDGAFDLVLSVFGLIFAEDPRAAFAELARVLRPGGRALIAVWVPAGAIDAMLRAFARGFAEASGGAPARFAWHDEQAVSELAGANGAEVHFHDGELPIFAASPEAYLRANEEHHPMSLAGRPLLERAGTYRAVREAALAALAEGNEDPGGFRVESPYRVIDARLGGRAA
jgi:SAM-dependent methyltransferase